LEYKYSYFANQNLEVQFNFIFSDTFANILYTPSCMHRYLHG